MEYRVGGGEEGNLMPGARWEIEGADGLNIINHRVANGGKDAETREKATQRFLKDLKTPYTAVTSEDFEFIAINTPGLRAAKAKAIPNYNPECPENGNGSVTVAIIPFTPLESFEIPPLPSEGFKNAICRHLDKHRLLGTDVHVISPIYVKVSVSVTIVPSNGFFDETLRQNVSDRLTRFLHPIKGGDESNGWPIGRNVYRSEIYEVIENIEGVNCVIKLSLSGDKGTTTDADGNLLLSSKISTIYSGTHRVRIVREADRCKRVGEDYAGK